MSVSSVFGQLLRGNCADIDLNHWSRVTHICVGKLIIIGSDNGLSPDRRQAIIWTNAGFLSIAPLRTYFRENLTKIQQFSLKKLHVKMSSAKWRLSCLGLNVLTVHYQCDPKTIIQNLRRLMKIQTLHPLNYAHGFVMIYHGSDWPILHVSFKVSLALGQSYSNHTSLPHRFRRKPNWPVYSANRWIDNTTICL